MPPSPLPVKPGTADVVSLTGFMLADPERSNGSLNKGLHCYMECFSDDWSSKFESNSKGNHIYQFEEKRLTK